MAKKKSPSQDFFEAEAGEDGATSPVLVGRLENLVKEELSLNNQLTQLDEDEKTIKGRLHQIRQREIPEVMGEIGTNLISVPSLDVKVEIDDFVAGTLPKDPDARKRALEELCRAGGEALLKVELSIFFPRSDAKKANELFSELKKRGFDLSIRESVHTGQLLAFAREALHTGQRINMKAIGLFSDRLAKISPMKKKAKKTT